MTIVSRVWQETVLAVQEDHGVSLLEKVFGGGGTARSGGEVVDEPDSLSF
jgi:hypothetical protein